VIAAPFPFAFCFYLFVFAFFLFISSGLYVTTVAGLKG